MDNRSIQRLNRAEDTSPHPRGCVALIFIFNLLFFFTHWDRLPEKLLQKLLLATGLGARRKPQRFLTDL